MASNFEKDEDLKNNYILQKNDYIGADGRRYSTYMAMVVANAAYWESMRINKNMYDIDNKKDIMFQNDYIGDDGIRYSTYGAMVVANAAYWESMMKREKPELVEEKNKIFPSYDHISNNNTDELEDIIFHESLHLIAKYSPDLFIGVDGMSYSTRDEMINADVEYWYNYLLPIIQPSEVDKLYYHDMLVVMIPCLANREFIDFASKQFYNFKDLAFSNSKIWRGLQELAEKYHDEVFDILENDKIDEKFYSDAGKRCNSLKEVIEANDKIWFRADSFAIRFPELLNEIEEYYKNGYGFLYKQGNTSRK